MPARLLRAALAAAALATALVPLGSHAVPPCGDEAKRTRVDGWVVLRRPAFSYGEAKIRSWAASPYVDGYLLATNGNSIARTLDGGCSWEEVYTSFLGLGETGIQSENSIYGVALPPSPPGRVPYTSWAIVSDSTGTRAVTSNDRGATWTDQASIGLPPLVALHGIWVTADPRIAYVLVDADSDILSAVQTELYVTKDGGQTFTPVKRGLDVSQYLRIAADPAVPKDVWAWDADSMYHSTDFGTTFAKVNGVSGPIGNVDILHFPAYAPARVIVYRADRATGSKSVDGGRTWVTVPTPGKVTGSSNLFTNGALATASNTGVFIEAPGFFSGRRDVSPRKLVLKNLGWAIEPAGSLNLYGSNGADLYVRKLTRKLELPPVELHSGEVIPQGPTTLVPENAVVRLKPGERRMLDYRLDLSPVPTPIDIFFAMDSTGSMSPVIASLRSDLQDIIDDLGSSGIDVWFGVGDFKDYPTFSPGDQPYRRFREVGPIDEDLEDAIEAIDVGGGNGLDSALTATYQAATGEGQRILDGSDAGGYYVKPGLGAEWREEALKVLVIAADVRSRDPENDPGYPGPSYAKVIDALNRLEIEHIGLAVGTNPEEPLQSLGRVSRGTRTLAPAGGADCNDDGEVDVEAGDPMVCTLSINSRGTNLAPAMVGLLRSLEDLQTVAITTRGENRIAHIAGEAMFDHVNVKTYNRMRFQVEAHCDLGSAGESFRHLIDARVGYRTVASTPLTVQCLPLPLKQRPLEAIFPPVPVRAIVAAAVPPPPPPPAPVPQPQPNPNPNPNPGANPQFGMTYAEQSEVQLALASNDIGPEEQEQLAMSRVREGDAAAMAVLGAGVLMAAGFATSTALRTRAAGRSQASPVRTR